MKGLIPNTGGFLAISNEPRKDMTGVFLYSYTPGMSFDVGHFNHNHDLIRWKYIVVATIGPLSIGAFAPDQFNRVDYSTANALDALKKITGFDNTLLKFYVSSVDWKAVSIQDQDTVTTTKQIGLHASGSKPNVSFIGGIKDKMMPSFYFSNKLNKLSESKKTSLDAWVNHLKMYFKTDEIDSIIETKFSNNNDIKGSWNSYKGYLLNDIKNPEDAITSGSKSLSKFLDLVKDIKDFDEYTPLLQKSGRDALYWHGYFYPDTFSSDHKKEVYDIDSKRFNDVFPSLSSNTPNVMSTGESQLFSVMSMVTTFNSTIYTGMGSTGVFNYTPTYSYYPNKTNYIINDTPQPTFKNGPTYTWGGITNYFDVNYRLMPGVSTTQEMTRFVEPSYSVVSGVDNAIYETTIAIILAGMKFQSNIFKLIINLIVRPVNTIIKSISEGMMTLMMISAIYENKANTDQTAGAGTYYDEDYKLVAHENVSNETFYRQKRYGFNGEKLGENARFYYYNIPVNKMYSEVAYNNDSGMFNSNKTQLNKDIWSMVHFKSPGTSQTPQDVSTYVNPHFIYGKFNIQMKYEKYFWLLLNKQNRGNA